MLANFEQVKTHKDLIRPGDIILHDGYPRTLSAKDIKRGGFMGTTILGDSYKLGYEPVIQFIYKGPQS